MNGLSTSNDFHDFTTIAISVDRPEGSDRLADGPGHRVGRSHSRVAASALGCRAYLHYEA